MGGLIPSRLRGALGRVAVNWQGQRSLGRAGRVCEVTNPHLKTAAVNMQAPDTQMTQDSLPRLLWSAAEVAGALGITADGVRGLHRTHALQGHIVSKKLKFRRQDVLAFVEGLGGNGKG